MIKEIRPKLLHNPVSAFAVKHGHRISRRRSWWRSTAAKLPQAKENNPKVISNKIKNTKSQN